MNPGQTAHKLKRIGEWIIVPAAVGVLADVLLERYVKCMTPHQAGVVITSLVADWIVHLISFAIAALFSVINLRSTRIALAFLVLALLSVRQITAFLIQHDAPVPWAVSGGIAIGLLLAFHLSLAFVFGTLGGITKPGNQDEDDEPDYTQFGLQQSLKNLGGIARSLGWVFLWVVTAALLIAALTIIARFILLKGVWMIVALDLGLCAAMLVFVYLAVAISALRADRTTSTPTPPSP